MRSLRLSLVALLFWIYPMRDALAQEAGIRLPAGITDGQRAAFEELRASEENARLEVRAIGQVADESVAMIDVNGHPVMATVSMTILGWNVSVINQVSQEVVLTRRGSQQPRVLKITNLRPINFPVLTEAQIERLLSPEALRRQAGRMGFLPLEVHRVWPRINRDAQEEILLNYLREGRVEGWIVDESGMSSSGFSRRLLEKRLRQRQAERRQAFLASLDEKQREVFMTAGAAINFVNPPPPAERERMMAQARAMKEERAKVVAALTPEQRLLYDNYMGMLGQPPSR